MTMFETAANLQSEKEIIDRFCESKNCKAIKLSYNYQLDYILLNDSKMCVGVCEVKNRTTEKQVEDVILSVKKFYQLKWWHSTFLTEAGKALACLFLVRLNGDFLGYRYNPEHKFQIQVAGRLNTKRVEQDIEPCVRIPLHLFKGF